MIFRFKSLPIAKFVFWNLVQFSVLGMVEAKIVILQIINLDFLSIYLLIFFDPFLSAMPDNMTIKFK